MGALCSHLPRRRIATPRATYEVSAHGEMVQGGVGYDGVEAAQSFARLEEVPVRPGHLGAGEALLRSLHNRLVDVHSDDPRYAL
jgi:hypothetical protein